MPSTNRILMPFANTNSFDKLIIDYLNDDDFLKDYYSYDDTPEGVKKRIETYQNKWLDRQKLKDVLIKQYNKSGILEIDKKVLENIHSLSDKKTFTVTTGHQLNIFSGPLYVIYKLISTINLAEKFKSLLPEYNFVPVYWMATEDHDINEITNINLFGRNFKWESEWKGTAGKMPLHGIENIINELRIVFGTSVFADELFSLISTAYLESSNLAEATRKWVDKFLGKNGLVIIDGNESLLKQSISEILIDEVINQTSSSIIIKTTSSLEKKYHSQAKPREINLFYVCDNYRERIIKENDKFRVLNTSLTFTVDQIKEEINTHPERFSPNVILRPIYQECILPNIAFVGGPSEISYWLELKELFNHHNVPMPVLFHRSCLLILEKSISNKLEKFSIKNSDVFLPADEMIKKFIHTKENGHPAFGNVTTAISDEFFKLSTAVTLIDPSLRAAVEAESQKVSTSLHTLEEKIVRSLKKKNEIEVNQIRKIKEKLFPGGKLQERHESLLTFYLSWGSSFIETLKDNLNPLEKNFLILEEK